MRLFGRIRYEPKGIEVSAEMMEAGVRVFVRYNPDGDLASETVAEIYQAMVEASLYPPEAKKLQVADPWCLLPESSPARTLG